MRASISAKSTWCLLNEATPVIGDIAMETITETIITESTMIGHNPGSPGGMGIGVGITIHITNLVSVKRGEPVIVVIPRGYDFEIAASLIKRALKPAWMFKAASCSLTMAC